MHILEMQILQFLEQNSASRHNAIYAAFQPLYKSSRTFYKAYSHLIRQKYIQKILPGGEKYYKYEITPIGRAFLHPNDPSLTIVPMIQEINEKIAATDDNEESPSQQISTLRTELHLLYSAIAALPKEIQNSLQSQAPIHTFSEPVIHSQYEPITSDLLQTDKSGLSSLEGLELRENHESTESYSDIDQNSDIFEGDDDYFDSEQPSQEIFSPSTNLDPIKQSSEKNNFSPEQIEPFSPSESVPEHITSSPVSSTSPIMDSKIVGILEGLMGAINGLNANILTLTNPPQKNEVPLSSNISVALTEDNKDIDSKLPSNVSAESSTENISKESDLRPSSKRSKASRKTNTNAFPSFADPTTNDSNLPNIGEIQLPDVSISDEHSESASPSLPPIIDELGSLSLSDLLSLVSQSFSIRDTSNLDDPYLLQISRIEKEFIIRSQRGENLTMVQKNELIGHYFEKDPPLAIDIDRLWLFLCQIPLQYQDLMILLPIVEFLIDNTNNKQIVEKFNQLPFFALESLLSQTSIKKKTDLYLSILELYLSHSNFREKKHSGSESTVKLWVQWFQHYLDQALRFFDYDEVLIKCDEILPGEDLDDIFYYLGVERLRDLTMMTIAETRMLRIIRDPSHSSYNEELKESFHNFQEAGGYQNYHLIDWYEKMHEEDILDFDDFMKELQIMLNLRAFSLIQSRIDQYGLFLAKDIKTKYSFSEGYHQSLLSPDLKDNDERTLLLRDILINSHYLQEKYNEIIERYQTSTDPYIFPWLIRAAIKLGVLPKKQWSLPVARPWWMLVTAQIELSIIDRNTEFVQFEALFRQQLNYGLTQHNPLDFFKTYFKEKPEMIRFAGHFARWQKEFGNFEYSLELVKLWELHVPFNLQYIDIHFDMLQLKRELLPGSKDQIDQQLLELENLQKHAYEHNIKETTSSSTIKRKKKSKKS